MRRIQLYFDEELDDELASEAASRGVSKAALVRELVRRSFPITGQDPIEGIIGQGDGDDVPDIDATLYGPV